MKMCISCGMPMTSLADYPLYNMTKNYCKLCARNDGSMQTFDEKWANLTHTLIKVHQMDENIAKDTAYVLLKKLPAWR